ncbi:MAG: spore maturation protein [Bacteroidota bacterium]|nr:spore maturation protein [Flavisolibacter sp.]MBD0350141.1 spore maturation protein [Flavisolibacter sp.]MDQ3845878.1 spore maturation protein [Bacteroidota bacterium]
MALSRIWSAFIIVAVLVALFRFFLAGDEKIFSRMVVGKADDPYDSVSYTLVGSPERQGFASKEAFEKYINSYGYRPADSTHPSEIIIAENSIGDSVGLLKAAFPAASVYTYRSIQSRLRKNADGIIETCKSAVNISIGLIGIMALFMGFMSIAERAGGIRLLSKIIGPFFSRVFPDIPKGHPSMGHMMMNFSANLLGLDNAATPFGIKAMESLQELNGSKDTASNAQIMFLCLHASGLTLIPVSIIAARAALRAQNPTDIFVPCMIATFVATMAAMFIVSFKQKINVLQPVIIAWIGGISAVIAVLVLYLTSLPHEGVQSFSSLLSNGLILAIFFLIILGALYKKINVFDAFINGAKGGFETAVRIIPYLVGMLVAISLLRTSGTFDVIINAMKSLFAALGTDTRFVDGLPTALIKPLSGSGARGMMIDAMKNFSPDSFAGRLSCILQGSSDTTFYVIAVYFGAVAIKDTRYAVGAMLLADLVGIITSILLCYMFFGASA